MRKQIIVGSILVMTSMGLVGCQQSVPPTKPPKEVVAEALEKSNAMTSGLFNSDIKFSIDAPSGGEVNKVEGNVSFNGGIDYIDVKKFKMFLGLKGGVDLVGQMQGNVVADAEVKFVDNTLFFKLSKLEGKDKLAEINQAVAIFSGKWWKYTMPEGVVEDFFTSLRKGSEDMSPEQKKMMEFVNEGRLFKDLKYERSEGGVDVYSFSLDKDGLVDFVAEIAKLQGTGPSEAEIKEAKASIKDLNVLGNMYIERNSSMITKTEVKVNFVEPNSGAKVVFEVSTGTKDVGKPVSVQAPADATDLPFGPQMFGAGMIEESSGGEGMIKVEEVEESKQ